MSRSSSIQKWHGIRDFRLNRISTLITFSLLIQLFVSIPAQVISSNSAEALSACSSTAAAQNSLKVTPTHGSAFYIDSGVSPKLDAGYVGYRVVNQSADIRNTLWVSLSNFTGGKMSLANPVDQYYQLDKLGATGSNSETSTAYILLKASGGTTSAQTHDVKIFDRRPDLNGAQALYQCTFTFSRVKETIKAAANKLVDGGTAASDFDTNSTAIDLSTTTAELGQNITMTIEGVTGQIGAGGIPDYDVFWVTPAALSSWPTAALRLVDSSIRFVKNDNTSWSSQVGTADSTSFDDTLLISNANGLTNVDGGRYVATFTFRVIGIPQASVLAVPLAFIASGTQMKHSDTNATGGTLTINFTAPTINYSLSKVVTNNSNLETTTVGGSTYVKVPYQLTATSTSATSTFIEEFVDVPPSSGIFETGTATVIDLDRASATSISDPAYIASESSLNPRPIHFIGPFRISSARSVVINYNMLLPAVANTYSNSAYIQVGEIQVGATTSTIPNVRVTTNGTNTITSETSTSTLSATVITQAASSVDTQTATLNGTIDPNGLGGLAKFQYGTSASLASYTEVTATTPASGTLTGANPIPVSVSLSGLSSGTTYYFRALTGSTFGDIFSFTTTGIVAAPTLVTLSASSVGTTTATLNGTIDPNNTFVYHIKFWYVASVTEPTAKFSGTDVNVVDGDGLAVQASGDGVQSFSKSISGLANGTIYWFYIGICTGSGDNSNCTADYFGTNKSFKTGLASQTISFETITSKTYGDSNITATATSSQGLTVTFASLTSSICTVSGTSVTLVAVGECTLRASQSGSATINPAEDVDQSFTIDPKTLTATAGDQSKIFGQSTPSNSLNLTGIRSGYDTATVTSAVYNYAGSGSTSYSQSTVAPSDVGSYSITPSNALLSFSGGSANNYVISYVAGSYTISAKTLTITADNKSKVFGATSPSFTATASGFAGSDTATVSSAVYTFLGVSGTTYASSTETPTAVGTYQITPSAGTLSFTSGSLSNYSLSYATGTYTISSASLSEQATLTISSATTVPFGDTLTLTTSGGSGNGSVTYVVTTAGSGGCSIAGSVLSTTGNVGATCGVTATKAADPTFNSKSSDQITITITARPISVKSVDKSKVYGSADPTLTSFTLTSGSLVGSDTFTVTANRASGDNVNTYAITPSAANFTSGQATNYSITYQTGTLTISAKTLTITADNKSKVFGATSPSFTATASGFAGSDTATVSSAVYTFLGVSGTTYASSTETPTAVGTYQITPSAGTLSFTSGSLSNYSLSYATGTYTISSAALTTRTLSLSGATVSYNATLALDATPSAGAGAKSYSTTDSGCSISSTTLTALSGTGTCIVTATIATDGTYVETSTTATITLAKINQTITFNTPSNMTVGGSAQSLSPTTTAITLSITITSNTTSICTISGSSVSAIAAGVCNLTASQGGNDNYNSAANVSVEFTISSSTTGSTENTNNNSQGPPPTPGPIISSVSKSLICVIGSELSISGNHFSGGRITLAGNSVSVIEISNNFIKVRLPSESLGRKTITVTTQYGSSTTEIEYVSVPKPVFQTIRIPYLAQGSMISLPFMATNTTSYSVLGKLPSGITINSASGLIYGTPTENGIFILNLVASGPCGETQQFVELDIDAPTPNAISHRINFLPGTCSIPDSAKASLEAFLAKAKGLSPRNIIPEIYVSGGGKASDPNSTLADCRQEAICDFLLLENLLGEVLSDVFTGAENRIEIIVYWPRPNDGQ